MNLFAGESVSCIRKERLRRIIEHGKHVPTALIDMVKKNSVDLVVIGRHGKSLVEHPLLGSVTLHLLAECPCDVLVTQ